MRKSLVFALLLALLLPLASCNGCSDSSAKQQQRDERNITLLFTTYVSGDYGPCG